MENFLKLLAVLLSLILVGSVYAALAWGFFQEPGFWVLYLLCLIADLRCIKLIKNIQNSNTH